MASSGILRRVALVIIDVSEELSASNIGVTKIGEVGIKLAVTRNRSFQISTFPCLQIFIAVKMYAVTLLLKTPYSLAYIYEFYHETHNFYFLYVIWR
jgi:hypothetical protein